MTINKLETLLDEFIERDPDAAERFIEAQLSRILLRKRLEQFKQEKIEQPPENCRQRLQKEGKLYPRSSCYACDPMAPKWKECEQCLNGQKAVSLPIMKS